MNICDYCIHKQTCTNKPLATTKCKDFEDKPKMTIFDLITQSPETLAKELVTLDCDSLWFAWGGIGRREAFSTREEAITATVAKLKEVEE